MNPNLFLVSLYIIFCVSFVRCSQFDLKIISNKTVESPNRKEPIHVENVTETSITTVTANTTKSINSTSVNNDTSPATEPPSTNIPTSEVITTKTPTTVTISTKETHTVTILPTLKVEEKEKDRDFDGPSFIGGIVLALGFTGIGFVAYKFFKARPETNYRNL